MQLKLLFSCSDYDQVINIINKFAVTLFTGYDLYLLRQWAERIPELFITAQPGLNIMAAWASHATGCPQQAKKYIRLIEETAGMSIEEFLNNPELAERPAGSYLFRSSGILCDPGPHCR